MFALFHRDNIIWGGPILKTQGIHNRPPIFRTEKVALFRILIVESRIFILRDFLSGIKSNYIGVPKSIIIVLLLLSQKPSYPNNKNTSIPLWQPFPTDCMWFWMQWRTRYTWKKHHQSDKNLFTKNFSQSDEKLLKKEFASVTKSYYKIDWLLIRLRDVDYLLKLKFISP